ncbi:hypothetical protein F4553_007899 [Allocatelliglobosispora scoriae]|uniref:Uncharacterized protein n=1 Tax=Allocatelliglobosispora scoriae TaxID=643052 RepID=A0A841C3K1_9ACTN|nr:hypothetical protein [Allocatelliglobosispora scoriae]MBB5874465.1 hypothetical protein [Allocatelliglobosispora scoriae]
MTRDAASILLDAAIRLLPPSRRDWGRAMRAELAELAPGPDRRSFARGCVRVIATQPATLRHAGYSLLMLAALATVAVWSTRIAYAPLHWGMVALVTLLVAVSWLGRRPGLLGPVRDDGPARLVRAGGYLLVGAMTAGFVASAATKGNAVEQAAYGVPIFAVALTSYLLGFLALTAHRTAATARVLVTGAGAGTAAAALWTVLAFAVPPIPTEVGLALVLTLIATALAAGGNAGHRGSPAHALLAGLSAGMVSALLIFVSVVVLSSYGPDSLIPNLVPAAITPADNLANSRIEIQDPYVAMLFVSSLLAIVLTAAGLATRRSPLRSDLAGDRV